MAGRRVTDALHGAVILDKALGPTSFSAMRAAGRALGVYRAGHTGTLDPAASGVLVVLLGEATKLSGLLVHDDKVYEAAIRLGVATDTLDAEGQVVAEAPVDPAVLAPERLTAALAAHLGPVLQAPPIYSAIKRDGRSLMSRARAGEEVEVEPRPVVCHALALIGVDRDLAAPTVHLRVHCGKGYYIRSLARDFGASLGVPAHLAGLRRTRVGPFDLARARPVEAIATAPVLSFPELLPDLLHLTASPAEARDLGHGRLIPRDPSLGHTRALALSPTGTPLALLRASSGLAAPAPGAPDGAHWAVERGFLIDTPPAAP